MVALTEGISSCHIVHISPNCGFQKQIEFHKIVPEGATPALPPCDPPRYLKRNHYRPKPPSTATPTTTPFQRLQKAPLSSLLFSSLPHATAQNPTGSSGNRCTTGKALRGRCEPMAPRVPGGCRAGVRPGRGSGTISGAHQARPEQSKSELSRGNQEGLRVASLAVGSQKQQGGPGDS